jgi:uncharacterized protein
LTGARQSGKTTLATAAFPGYAHISLDSPVERSIYAKMLPADWISRYPKAIIDEAQKLPGIFETIKACYDRDPGVRYLLLGSSQILLLKKVRETLAGRVAIRELFPFNLPELISVFSGIRLSDSRLIALLRAPSPSRIMPEFFPPELPLGESEARAKEAWDYLSRWGGMPAILGSEWSDEDRFEWLRDYQGTYLQRDVADLAHLDRLEPFVRAQEAAALKTARTINFSNLARLAEVSAHTARQFMRYLELSYQILLLPAWFRNQEKRLSRQPKLHFIDQGVRRAILKKRGIIEGEEFESAVAAEIWKQARTARLPITIYHLRTPDGREVDLLLEREDGFLVIECKMTTNVSPVDFRNLRNLEQILDKPLLLKLVVSNDPRPRSVVPGEIPGWNVAAHQLLGS